MTKRSIVTGKTPYVVIKAGTSVTVEAHDSDQVVAETAGRWGLKIDVRSEAEVMRARLDMGEKTLFDVRLKRQNNREDETPDEELTEIQIGSEGKVWVPLGSRVKVYAGANAEISGIRGRLSVVAGGNARIRNTRLIVNASAGGALDLECQAFEGDEIKFEAGRDLRCYIRDLTSATIIVSDLGGNWQGQMGEGAVTLRLKAGGDAILVTDQVVEPSGPNSILGQIEKPLPTTTE